jgi:hypothetical protein
MLAMVQTSHGTDVSERARSKMPDQGKSGQLEHDVHSHAGHWKFDLPSMAGDLSDVN